ncbi:MAG: hypothetical protein V5A20_12760 [Salinibacter sp.]|uniref:hypothetical protein n=1 Tax=Salinibacter sp. TaxID=2065818 RepID=UPI002FC3D73D
MSFPASWRPPAVVGTLILSVLLLVAGCSDDPILGPNDGKEQEGGSYSTIKRLAPSDSATSPAPNPERF